jgi:hypothetical protein
MFTMSETQRVCGVGSPASMEGAEDCVISSEVKGNSLEIVNWSTLWSQVLACRNAAAADAGGALKGSLLAPLLLGDVDGWQVTREMMSCFRAWHARSCE